MNRWVQRVEGRFAMAAIIGYIYDRFLA
jgi:hypothetical protein